MGYDVNFIQSFKNNLQWLKGLKRSDVRKIARLIVRTFGALDNSVIRRLRDGSYSLEDVAKGMKMVRAKPEYLIWVNSSLTREQNLIFPDAVAIDVCNGRDGSRSSPSL